MLRYIPLIAILFSVPSFAAQHEDSDGAEKEERYLAAPMTDQMWKDMSPEGKRAYAQVTRQMLQQAEGYRNCLPQDLDEFQYSLDMWISNNDKPTPVLFSVAILAANFCQ